MRGALAWIVAIVAGIVLVLVVTARSATRDDSGETVTAGEWAQSVCGAVGVWRGEMEDIVEELRTPSDVRGCGTRSRSRRRRREGPGSCAQGSSAPCRRPRRWSTGIDNAGTPDTPEGERGGDARLRLGRLRPRRSRGRRRTRSTRRRTRSRRRSTQLTDAAGAIGAALASGVQTIAEVGRTRPRARGSVQESSTCQQLREETELAMSTMDWILVVVQGLVVIGFIALGVRSGGIGLGLWGGVGTLVLVFVFGLDPGEPPISAILIIIAVISAAAAMQAAGRRRLHGPGREQGAARAGRRRSTSSRRTSPTCSRS